MSLESRECKQQPEGEVFVDSLQNYLPLVVPTNCGVVVQGCVPVVKRTQLFKLREHFFDVIDMPQSSFRRIMVNAGFTDPIWPLGEESFYFVNPIRNLEFNFSQQAEWLGFRKEPVDSLVFCSSEIKDFKQLILAWETVNLLQQHASLKNLKEENISHFKTPFMAIGNIFWLPRWRGSKEDNDFLSVEMFVTGSLLTKALSEISNCEQNQPCLPGITKHASGLMDQLGQLDPSSQDTRINARLTTLQTESGRKIMLPEFTLGLYEDLGMTKFEVKLDKEQKDVVYIRSQTALIKKEPGWNGWAERRIAALTLSTASFVNYLRSLVTVSTPGVE